MIIAAVVTVYAIVLWFVWKSQDSLTGYETPRALKVSEHLIYLPTFKDPRGFLTVAEKLPFPIKRVYWIYGVPEEAMRGGHAHKKVQRLVIPVIGTFRAKIFDEDVLLSESHRGLLVPSVTWLELYDFSPGSVCLILASEEHDEKDCLRTKEEFDNYRKAND